MTNYDLHFFAALMLSLALGTTSIVQSSKLHQTNLALAEANAKVSQLQAELRMSTMPAPVEELCETQ